MNRNNDWIIDNACSRHIIRDKDKFMTMEQCDGGLDKFGNGSPCVIRGKFIITLTDDITCDDVYWEYGL